MTRAVEQLKRFIRRWRGRHWMCRGCDKRVFAFSPCPRHPLIRERVLSGEITAAERAP